MKQIKVNNLSFDIELEVRNIYGEKYETHISDKESNENKFVFINEEHKLFACVLFESQDNSVCVKFDCRVGAFGGYDLNEKFSAYNSVILRLYDNNSIRSIMGSEYCIGEKSDCWASVYHSNSFDKLPNRSASVFWKNGDMYYHMLPLCDNDFKGEIKNIDNCMCITFSPYCSGYSHIYGCGAVVTWDKNPYKAAHDNVASGFKFLNLKNSMTENKRCSEIFNYIGWCSWDGFRLDVNADGIYRKLNEFKEKNIPMGWILLDDGWYPENKERKIESFYEDCKKFPEGLTEFVKRVKENKIRNVGIWECFGGGWYGIAENSDITQNYAEVVCKLPSGELFPKTDEAGSFIYWNRRHQYLSKCGFDFLKIDVECAMEACIHGQGGIGKIAGESLKGMEASVGLYFDGACINCTGMGQEALWNRKVGMVNRNSADFIPGKAETMNRFVNDNIFNSFYHSYFSVTDWDMMWSDDVTSRMNIVLHAVCGGLVYFSDPVGKSKRENIIPFCMDDGRLLKCDKYAMPTIDCLFHDSFNEPYALKAWNMSGESGVLGIFNTYKGESVIDGEFRINDIYDISGEKFLLYDWFNKSICVSNAKEIHKVKINPFEAFLYIAVPIINGVAVLGDTDKYIPTSIIKKRIINGNIINLILKTGCELSIYSEKNISVEVNGINKTLKKAGSIYVADCSQFGEDTIVTVETIIN